MMFDLTCKKTCGVDAIITDLMVPALNGYEVIPVENDDGKVLTGFTNDFESNTGEFTQTDVGNLKLHNVNESASTALEGGSLLDAFENTKTVIDTLIGSSEILHVLGESSRVITNGSTVKPVINGQEKNPETYNIVQYADNAFIWIQDKWVMLTSPNVDMTVTNHTLNITIE